MQIARECNSISALLWYIARAELLNRRCLLLLMKGVRFISKLKFIVWLSINRLQKEYVHSCLDTVQCVQPTATYKLKNLAKQLKRLNFKNPEVPNPHWFSFLPNRTHLAHLPCSIPWRSREQNQQHQWWKALKILSLSIFCNSHRARQCFLCHGNNRINGKTWRIKLSITNFVYNTLSQQCASCTLIFIILSFHLLLQTYIIQNQIHSFLGNWLLRISVVRFSLLRFFQIILFLL